MPGDLRACLRQVQAGAEDQLEERLQLRTVLGIEACTAQTNDIEPGETIEKHRAAIRRDVFAEAAIALCHAVAADAEDLMEDRTSTDDAVVPQLHMPGEEGRIGDHVVVPDLHIVRKVNRGHDEVPVSHSGDGTSL